MKTQLSVIVLFAFSLIGLGLSACNMDVLAETASPETEVTPTIMFTSTATVVPSKTPKPTSTPNIAATQKYEDFYALVDKLANEGVIESTKGKYHPLDDYSDSFAQSAYYNWGTYEAVQTSNFIMQAQVKISNAITENVFKSACGFVMDAGYIHHAIFFALDGNVNFRTDGRDRGSNYLDASLFQNAEGVRLTLVLSNKTLLFYVNDKKAFNQIVYEGPFSVGPSILSGTSEGFGTRCEFTDIVLWDMD